MRTSVKGFDGSSTAEHLMPNGNPESGSLSFEKNNQAVIIGYGDRNITIWDPQTLNVVNNSFILGNATYLKIVPPLSEYRLYSGIKAYGLLVDQDSVNGKYGHLFFSILKNGNTRNEGRLFIPNPIVDMCAGLSAGWFIAYNRIYHHYLQDTFYTWWDINIQNPDIIESLGGGFKQETIAVITNFKSKSKLRILSFNGDSMKLKTDTVLTIDGKVTALKYSIKSSALYLGMKNGDVYCLKKGVYKFKKIYKSKKSLDPAVEMQLAGDKEQFIFIRNEYGGLHRVRLKPYWFPWRNKKILTFLEGFIASDDGKKILGLHRHDLEFYKVGKKKPVEIKSNTVSNYLEDAPLQISENGRFITAMEQLLDLGTGDSPMFHWFNTNDEFNPGEFEFSGNLLVGEMQHNVGNTLEKKLRIIDVEKEQILKDIQLDSFDTKSITVRLFFSKDRDTLWRFDDQNNLQGCQISTGNKVANYNMGQFTGRVRDGLKNLDYLQNSSLFSIVGDTFFMCNLATKKIIFKKVFEPRFSVYEIRLNPRIWMLNDSLLVVSNQEFGDSIQIYNIKTNKFNQLMFDQPINDAVHMPGDSMLVIALDNGKVVWINGKGEVQKSLDVASSVQHIAFDAQGHRWFLQTETGEIQCKNQRMDSLFFTLYPTENTTNFDRGWVITDGYYYMCNPEHLHYVYHVNNFSGVSLSAREYEPYLNRPDEILKKLGHASKGYLATLNKLWKQRLVSAGIDSLGLIQRIISSDTNIKAPKIYTEGTEVSEYGDIFQPVSLKFPKITNQKKINLKIGLECFYRIEGGNYTQNGTRIRLTKKRHFSINHKHTTTAGNEFYDVELRNLNLKPGVNHFQFVVKDTAGLRSKPYEEWIYCTNKKTRKPRLFLLSLGVSRYQDSTHNLNYAAQDAKSIQKFFKKQGKKIGFSKIYTKILTDEGVLNNLKPYINFLNKAREEDVVIVFMAGHGMLDSANEFCFAPYNMDFSHPEKNGIRYYNLVNTIDKCNSRKKVILLDACHSGTMITLKDTQVKNSVAINSSGGRGVSIENSQFADQNLIDVGPLMDQVLGSYHVNGGTTVIAAADGTGFAFEAGEFKHGVFTYSLLNILSDTATKYLLLVTLQQRLNEMVRKISGSNQQIRINTYNPELDWYIVRRKK